MLIEISAISLTSSGLCVMLSVVSCIFVLACELSMDVDGSQNDISK